MNMKPVSDEGMAKILHLNQCHQEDEWLRDPAWRARHPLPTAQRVVNEEEGRDNVKETS